jgi:HAE1 family hydrophobic/amphiphilic exporter-1
MIRWAATRPAVVLAGCGALVLAGGVALARLPVATRPYVELPRLNVAMNWPGASAELVETYLGSPIEAAIQSVRGIRKINSESGEGYVQLDVQLEQGADVQIARLSILERLEVLRSEFPPGASGLEVSNYVPRDLNEEPLQRYTVYGPYTAGALQQLVDREVKPRLSAVEGVAGVNARGGALVGVAVAYRPERLRQLGISPGQLAEALSRARAVQALGVERAGTSERRVALRDIPGVIEDLGSLPVRGPAGQVYRLGDLATIRRDEDNQDGFFRVNGEPAVMMQIARLPGADAIQTADRVRKALTGLVPRLPPGVRFQVMGDESVRLAEQLGDLARRGAIAFVAVLLVLALALQAPRAVLLVMASAAVAIAGTTLGLYLLDVPANLLTLAGLGMGVGILVQDGVVVIDRFRTVPDTAAGRASAAARITPAVVGSTLTTAVVLFPFLYLQGDARAAFTPFAVAFSLALGCSIVTSLLMLPALSRHHGMHEVRWRLLQRAYTQMVIRLLRWRWATIGVTLLLVAGLGYVFATRVPRSSFGGWWTGQKTALVASVDFPSGSDPGTIDRSVAELERIVVARPGVELVQAQGGPGGGMLQAVFNDRAARSVLPYQMQEELIQRAALIGGAAVTVRGFGPGFASGGASGALQSFRIKLLGYSFSGVERLARDLKARLERIPRVRSVDINAAGFWFGSERAATLPSGPTGRRWRAMGSQAAISPRR